MFIWNLAGLIDLVWISNNIPQIDRLFLDGRSSRLVHGGFFGIASHRHSNSTNSRIPCDSTVIRLEMVGWD